MKDWMGGLNGCPLISPCNPRSHDPESPDAGVGLERRSRSDSTGGRSGGKERGHPRRNADGGTREERGEERGRRGTEERAEERGHPRRNAQECGHPRNAYRGTRIEERGHPWTEERGHPCVDEERARNADTHVLTMWVRHRGPELQFEDAWLFGRADTHVLTFHVLTFDKDERGPDDELRLQFEAMRGFSD